MDFYLPTVTRVLATHNVYYVYIYTYTYIYIQVNYVTSHEITVLLKNPKCLAPSNRSIGENNAGISRILFPNSEAMLPMESQGLFFCRHLGGGGTFNPEIMPQQIVKFKNPSCFMNPTSLIGGVWRLTGKKTFWSQNDGEGKAS